MSGANGQGKCRGLPPTAFPSSSRFSRSLFFYFMFQIALLRQGTASACRNQRLMDAPSAAEGFSVLHRRPKAVRFSEETQT
jgi:hypothetical protein